MFCVVRSIKIWSRIFCASWSLSIIALDVDMKESGSRGGEYTVTWKRVGAGVTPSLSTTALFPS
jgi:hypothetical protein